MWLDTKTDIELGKKVDLGMELEINSYNSSTKVSSTVNLPSSLTILYFHVCHNLSPHPTLLLILRAYLCNSLLKVQLAPHRVIPSFPLNCSYLAPKHLSSNINRRHETQFFSCTTGCAKMTQHPTSTLTPKPNLFSALYTNFLLHIRSCTTVASSLT